jgi:hypothetical protein
MRRPKNIDAELEALAARTRALILGVRAFDFSRNSCGLGLRKYRQRRERT